MSIQLDDLEGGESRSHADEAVLQIIDAPVDGSSPQIRATFILADDIAGGLRQLPSHDTGIARVFDLTFCEEVIDTSPQEAQDGETTPNAEQALEQFILDAYAQNASFRDPCGFHALRDDLLLNEANCITAQWTQRHQSDTSYLPPLVNHTSLQQYPSDHQLHRENSYFSCAQVSDNRLIIITRHEVKSTQEFHDYSYETSYKAITFQNPRIIPPMIDGTSWSSLSDGSLETFAKLMVLDFFLASIYLQDVNYYGKLIATGESDQVNMSRKLNESPHLRISLGILPILSLEDNDAIKDIELAEGILQSIKNLSDSIKWVIEALVFDRAPDSITISYQTRLRGLKALIRERCMNSDRALNALNRQLDYQTKVHAIRDSKAIKRLTIFAALYLPLSLSASLLGMQTPFRLIAHARTTDRVDLSRTSLLFDFVGVFAVLSSSAVFVLRGIRLGLQLDSTRLRRTFGWTFSLSSWSSLGRIDKVVDGISIISGWLVTAGTCIILTAWFLWIMLQPDETDLLSIAVAWVSTWTGVLLVLTSVSIILRRWRYRIRTSEAQRTG